MMMLVCGNYVRSSDLGCRLMDGMRFPGSAQDPSACCAARSKTNPKRTQRTHDPTAFLSHQQGFDGYEPNSKCSKRTHYFDARGSDVGRWAVLGPPDGWPG